MTTFFQKLFGSRKPPSETTDVPTIPIEYEEGEEEEPSPPESTQTHKSRFEVGFSQSIGKQRQHNEDAIFSITTNLVSNQDFIPLGLYIVADGMGGHKHGEIASELAVRVVVEQVVSKVFVPLLAPNPSSPEESIQEIMQNSVQQAHQAIVDECPGSGTTLTAMLIMDEQMTLAHVGDSRVYHILPDGSLEALTRDHSLVTRMMELGQLTEEEASIHPQRNVLYRALGQGEPFMPDVTTLPFPESGHLLLCSDGLWGVVQGQKLSALVKTSPDVQVACKLLVDAANAAGGPDNISAILIKILD